MNAVAGGWAGAALAALLDRESRGDAPKPHSPLGAKRPHFAAKAKAVIQVFCPGGLSHVDTWDHKPELERLHGQAFDAELGKQTFAGIAGNYSKSFWAFRKHGQCGRAISDLFPKLATHVDEMAFIHSMANKSALHGPAMFMMNSGFIRPGFPSMGSWVTYGLGSENENLPAFVALPDPRGLPPGGVANWGAGFLPAAHQGTTIATAKGQAPIADLFPERARPDAERAGREFLAKVNAAHAAARGDGLLEARIAAYELAARLQLSAPEALDLAKESAAVQKLYALEDPDVGPFGRQCLTARRLVERGVRFVQVFCGAENTSALKIRPNWDSHEDIRQDHGYWGRVLDVGAAALLVDLKSRGLLDSTLVICASEFGRQPFMQGKQKGRDHNPGAFTAWLAGGGIKGGTTFGRSDDRGWQAVSPTYSYDLHATALHLLGLDHEKLTFYQNGIPRRLTDVHGRVIREILA
ncbi:MAG TPA: DUF1501 domain-containing protein [Planctomycetia bacterium]|nr:DUF1501 domain-containing protein [Planctomycetia bacterium]